jgi:hypothetical protein
MEDHSGDNSSTRVPAVSGTVKSQTEFISEESGCFEENINY